MRRADIVGACLILASMVLALSLAGAVAIAALPPQLQQRLPQLPAQLQQQLRANDAVWTAMTPAQQHALRARAVAWGALPATIRREQREHWQAWRALPVDQRVQIQAAALAFAGLPADRQLALRGQFTQFNASERHGWLLGPALGGDITSLQPLLQQVPAPQREPLLAVLRAMTPVQRHDLAVLAQRTAPQQRDELRRALLSTAATNRAAWLQLRLEQ